MPELIREFPDGSRVEYDRGSFDDWCVYLTRPNVPRYAPKDIEYFTFFKNMSEIYVDNDVYRDYVQIYDMTNHQIEGGIFNHITELSQQYNGQALDFDIYLTIVYAAMVAEENKRNTRLGKRVKRLGMCQVLVENEEPQIAANFSKGMGWREIARICDERGF